MIFVDTNVVMFAVGREHPLRAEAREFFESNLDAPLCTSAEVLQELIHAYLPVQRMATLAAAFTLVERSVPQIFPIEAEDVRSALMLVDRHPELGSRDLLHLAICRRHAIKKIKTFDRALGAAFRKR
ncbi:MAG TPA: type II toxin-antitoxin system VapC family toxin [Polyangiales bacterium]